MPNCQLTVTAAQYQLLLKRRTTIESKFDVVITTPESNFYEQFPSGEISDYFKTLITNEVFVCSISGGDNNIKSSTEYITDALIHPEIIEIYSYHKDLKKFLCTRFWNEVIERIHNVYITLGTDHELVLSGTELSVASAVSYLQKLTDIYYSNIDSPIVNMSLAHELSKALKNIRKKDFQPVWFEYSDSVNELLLSWLKEAYQSHFLNFNGSGDFNPSIDILDTPSGSGNLNNSVQCLTDSLHNGDDSVVIIDSDDNEKCGNPIELEKNGLGSSKMCSVKSKGSKRKKKNILKQIRDTAIAGFTGKSSETPQMVTTTADIEDENCQRQLKTELPDVLLLSCTNATKASLPAVKTDYFGFVQSGALPSLSNLPDFIPLCSNSATDVSLQPAKRRKKMRSNMASVENAVSLPPAALNIPPLVPEVPRRLRPIVIDGSNIAMAHGVSKVFSCQGISLCIDYFQKRGHTSITAFVPQSRRHHYYNGISDREILDQLAEKQLVVFTPSRKSADGVRITCYDDRFIVDFASRVGGVIVSNDGYRDLFKENPDWKQVIEERVLMFCFVGDILMFPDDPLGAKGPRLNDFLSFPNK